MIRVALRRLAIGAALAGLLAACFPLRPLELPLTQTQAEDRTPPVAMPVAHAWINPPGILLVTQRTLVRGSEQRIALTNATTLGGDNVAILRTRLMYGVPARFNYEELLRRAGGLPSPFEDATAGEMLTASDEIGDYLWAERTLGSDTVCVLALRRVASAARQLPGGADAMDIMLRNCVRGTVEQALKPILAASVATSPLASPAPGQTRLISPLAGPNMQ